MIHFPNRRRTSRERPKSAPYQRLKKVSQCQKNFKGDLLGFFNIDSVAKRRKIGGGLCGDILFRKKCSTMPKTTPRWDPLVSSGIVCYLILYCIVSFWFSSLGQQVHFGDTLNFCRTFGRTIFVFSGVSKKTLTKSHDYSRLFS